ncbi:putative MFS-type transporter EfpA [Baekduia alba]|uniref:MFS transporter n=1 Tax=Baekduia alba TaxID=2997333 RepID=UPI00234088A5|nr:MFS transporter [Baekduia alba]WCB96710.1 putative MFS-type transporter EfpA [Baekduia alba]
MATATTTPEAETDASALGTRRGKLTLALLCTIAFLDFVDASIVNVALPTMGEDLGFSVQNLQWVVSGYLLTYGGFMLLGGRAADLFGRQRILVAGTVVFALSSLTGGLAQSSGMLVAARLVQGLGAAMMLPAALSLLTTTFTGTDRHKALGVWGGVAGLASAVGVLLGGVLSDGPGWRWVLLVNEPVCIAAVICIYLLFEDDRRHPDLRKLDLRGAVLSTSGMLLLVYTLVKAPDVGWGAGRTVAGLAGAVALLVIFVANEARSANPLLPLSIFRIKGLAAANVTQLIGVAGIISMFFFLTLYMQNVLGYSQIKTGLAYLPLCFGVGIAAGISSQLLAKVGTRPVMIGGALLASGGVFWLSKVPVGGSFLSDMLPGMMLASFGLGAVFVSVTTAANEGVPADQAGLAAALLNAFQQVGGALGLAVFSALATSRTSNQLADHVPPPEALTAGFQRALLACSICLAAAALFAMRTSNTRGELVDPQAVDDEQARHTSVLDAV